MPVSAPSMVAASRTVRHIGPGVSWRVRNRNDAGAADQADGRLDADDAVGGRRADDRAVRFRADRAGAKIRGSRRT